MFYLYIPAPLASLAFLSLLLCRIEKCMSAACVHQGFSEKEAEWVQILFRVWIAKLFCLEMVFLQFTLCLHRKQILIYPLFTEGQILLCCSKLQPSYCCCSPQAFLLSLMHASIQLSVDQSADYFSKTKLSTKYLISTQFSCCCTLWAASQAGENRGCWEGWAAQVCVIVPWNMVAGSAGHFMSISITEIYAVVWVPTYRDTSLLDTVSRM